MRFVLREQQRRDPVPITDGLAQLARDRSLPVDLLAQVGIRVEDGEYPIVIPYRNLVGMWYERRRRALDDHGEKKYLSERGSVSHLYNPFHLGPNVDEIWIAEGEFDTLSLISIGIPAVGIQGTGHWNAKLWPLLYATATIIIALDGDEAGRSASSKIRDSMEGKHGIEALIFPTPEGRDLNELLQEGLLSPLVADYRKREGIEDQREDDAGSAQPGHGGNES